MGDSDRWRERASQWFPQAPVSIVSPVAHLTHSLCWAKGKSDWAHYTLLRTDARRERERERASSVSHCEWTPSLSGVHGHLLRLSLSNLALLCLCAVGTNESDLSPFMTAPGHSKRRRVYWHSLSHPLGWVVNEKGWMTDTVKGMWGNVHVATDDWWHGWWTVQQAGCFPLSLKQICVLL